MVSLRERFLGRFNTDSRSDVVQYGKRLTEASRATDILLLMARKAACFADCLEYLRLARFDCGVVSDRILDCNAAWLGGKQITIFDDALISGTTLYRVMQRLQANGVRRNDIRVQVLCVNTRWHQKQFIQPDPPYLELSDNDTAAMCASIVEAMSLIPRPYAVDYPVFKRLRLPVTAVPAITSMDGWDVDEVTTPLQAAHNVFSLTFTPSESTLKAFDHSLGWPFRECGLHKIRLYGRLADRGRDVYWCYVVPMVAMEPLATAIVAQLFESAAGHTGNKGQFDDWFTTSDRSERQRDKPAAQLRLVAFVAAHRLGQLWFRDVEQILATSVERIQDRRTYDHLFPSPAIPRIQELCDSTEAIFRHATVLPVPRPLPALLAHASGPGRLPDQTAVEKNLTAPFLRLYREKEIRARELAQSLGCAVFDHPEYRAVMDRLRKGFTLHRIRHSAENLADVADTDRLLSLFLDRAIDRGAVVPITCVRGSQVYRGFRHGEDVEFGEEEERLCVQMLSALAETSNQPEMPRTWVEKSLVLLIRAGLEQRFFNAWEHTLGDFKSMGIRYSLHGAVVATGSNKIYHTVKHFGLPELMQQHGYIAPAENGNRWTVAQVPSGGTHANRSSRAQLIGALLGKVLAIGRATDDAHLTNEELTLLATCLYPKDLCGALAAEIDITARDWYLSPAFSRRNNTDTAPLALDGRAESLRRCNGFIAVNSGIWKAKSFGEQRSWQIVERVLTSLKDPVYRAAWSGMWPTGGRQGRLSIQPNLLSLIDREKVWLHTFRTLVLMLECVYRQSAIRAGQNVADAGKLSKRLRRLARAVGELRDSAAELSGKISIAAKRLATTINSADLDLRVVAQFVFDEMDRCAHEARAILSEVDALAATFGRPEELQYLHNVLHVDVAASPRAHPNAWSRVFSAVRRIRSEALRRNSQTTIAKIHRDDCGIKRGLWLVASGDLGRTWLTRLAVAILSEAAEDTAVTCTQFVNLRPSLALIRPGKSSIYTGPLFWDAAAVTFSDPSQDRSTVLQLVVDPDQCDVRTIHRDIERESRSVPLQRTSRAKIRCVSGDLDTFSYRRRSAIVFKEEPCIGVLCVVPDEMKAIKNFLRGAPNYWEFEGTRFQRDFCSAELPSADDQPHRVVVTRALEQGNRSIMPAYQALMDECHPRLIVLLGIGGGIHKDCDLCDVVLADTIFYYDKRTETEVGTKHRLLPYRIEAWLERYINRFFDDHGEHAVLPAATDSIAMNFKFHYGPVGTGEAVVKFRDGETRKWLTTVNDKTLALETEAGGVAQQFLEDTLREGEKALGYLVIRGVSDHADQDKDNKWRGPATTNAMHALSAVLKKIPKQFGIARTAAVGS